MGLFDRFIMFKFDLISFIIHNYGNGSSNLFLILDFCHEVNSKFYINTPADLVQI